MEFGLVSLVTYGALYIDGAAGARHEMERFALLQAVALQQPPAPDLSLWDPGRITAWRRALSEPAPPPLAVLRIPKIRLEVPVLRGTDDFTLNILDIPMRIGVRGPARVEARIP